MADLPPIAYNDLRHLKIFKALGVHPKYRMARGEKGLDQIRED